jgi:Co/Zn/Cd efflux system component
MGVGHDHGTTFEGLNDDYKRRLIAVTAINIGMFFVEMSAGQFSGSQALKADALDFFADGVTYALSFWAIGKPLTVRATAAFAKGLSLVAIGLWIAITTLYQLFVHGIPEASVMSVVGLLALAANLLSVWLLVAYKDGDANIRSVWLCSRNDAIGNVAVVMAAIAVAILGNGAPDLIVAGVMAALFLTSATQILKQSYAEWRHSREHLDHDHDH